MSSLAQVMAEVGIAGEDDTSKVVTITSSFYSDLYTLDGSNIQVNEEIAEEMQEEYGGVFNIF